MPEEPFVSAQPARSSIAAGRPDRVAPEIPTAPARGETSAAGARLARLARLFWLVLALGAVLRLTTLGVQSLWLDEGVSFWTVNRSLPDLIETLFPGFRPLFFLVLYPFYLLGTQEWLLRLPSALAGIASLGMIYLLGRELFDHATALLAAALLALSPLHLWYSQEARFYALAGLLALGAVYFAVRGLKDNRVHHWVLFGIFEGLGLWTESAAVWYVLAINLSGLLLARRLLGERRIFGWALAQAIGLAIYLPQVATFVSAVQGSSASWIPPATVRALLRVMSDFAGGFMHAGWFGILSLLGVGLGLLLGLAGTALEAPRRWLAYAVLLPWLVIPITTSFVISQPYYRPESLQAVFSRPSIFLTRNLITMLFPLLLLLARSLVLLSRRPARVWRWLGYGLAGGLLALYAVGYFDNHLVPRKENYRAAANLVEANVSSGDLVLTSPGYIEQPLAYYYYGKEPPSGLSLESVRDGVVDSSPARQDAARLRRVEQDLEGLILQHERVWLVTNDNIHQQPDRALVGYLEQQAVLERVDQLEGMLVRLYRVPGAEASSR